VLRRVVGRGPRLRALSLGPIWASKLKFLHAPTEFALWRQALGLASGFGLLPTRGSAAGVRTRAVAWRLAW
jgi:hypothetical protein